MISLTFMIVNAIKNKCTINSNYTNILNSLFDLFEPRPGIQTHWCFSPTSLLSKLCDLGNNHLMPLCIGLLICKVGVTSFPHQVCGENAAREAGEPS